MTITRIYNGTPVNGIGTTLNFSNASALYMIAPDITDEIEVDFYLQFAISIFDNRLLKLNESYTLDTLSIYVIPNELLELDREMYGVFTTSSNIALEIYVIESDFSVKESLEEILQQIKDFRTQFATDTTREIATDLTFALADTQLNLALGALATSLSPLTLGASVVGTLPALATSTTTLTPLLGTLLLP